MDILRNDVVRYPFRDGRARRNPKRRIGVVRKGGEFGEKFVVGGR